MNNSISISKINMMETTDKNDKISNPEKTGKIPASGIISETYKEEVNPQDLLDSSKDDFGDPNKSQDQKDDFDSYPLEEADTGEDHEDRERLNDRKPNDNEVDRSDSEKDEFLK